MSTRHLKLFYPPATTHTHCFSDRKHDFPVRWLQWAWLSALYSYNFSTNANISKLQLHRACLASGSEGRLFVKRWREQPQKQLLPLSLLFSFDKESSFCLSDFLCLWPSIEDTDHLSIKTHYCLIGPPLHMSPPRSPLRMKQENGVDFSQNKQLCFSDWCSLHLGMVMWQPMSRSRSILLKATSCRRHRSSSERLCRGTGLRPMLRPDTLFQVKSPWRHAADAEHTAFSTVSALQVHG